MFSWTSYPFSPSLIWICGLEECKMYIRLPTVSNSNRRTKHSWFGAERNPLALTSPNSDKTPFHITGKTARWKAEQWNPLPGWLMSQGSLSITVRDFPGLWMSSSMHWNNCSSARHATALFTASQIGKARTGNTPKSTSPKSTGLQPKLLPHSRVWWTRLCMLASAALKKLGVMPN